jgi:hypothetical protein
MASAADRVWHVHLLLGAYVLGGLSTAEEAAVRAHLERCAQCQAEHDELALVPSWLDLLGEADTGTDPVLAADWDGGLAHDHAEAGQEPEPEPDRPHGVQGPGGGEA